MTNKSKIFLVTGSSGFIGFHICKTLLDNGHVVFGVDNLDDYYDVKLKLDRQKILAKYKNFSISNESITNSNMILGLFQKANPDCVIHLAAQAGVRYSIDNPRAYLNTNIVGTFEILEACRLFNTSHLMIASTSSAYGANETMPYTENQKCDHQLSFYAATKKATENLGHSYSHIHQLPITFFRFFTVYGPWGRPDMALFKFTKAILSDEAIDVYNHGIMERDFTYIDDLVTAIFKLTECVPTFNEGAENKKDFDSLSPVAPFRVVNIGNSNSESLTNFISEIERGLNKSAKKNFLPMQQGDVPATWSDVSLLEHLTGYKPNTSVEIGVKKFIDWYLEYYQK
jgi:UDP-glucuronate 4-epimerase